ncbi:MAG: LLM class flavin-dependent oxidoreductase [Actinobacteria bacterium]|nr:LLM class flavin-dependent oxidoreductase [Actinomycetota bacterium]
MQRGVQLAHRGPQADEDTVRAAARSAEVLGFHSLWAVDLRLAARWSGTPVARGFDPLTALELAAASTERVGLGLHLSTGEGLAHSLGTLTQLMSADRVTVAVDLDGWGDDDLIDVLTRSRWPSDRAPLVSTGEATLGALIRFAAGWLATGRSVRAIDVAWETVRAATGMGRGAPPSLVVRAEVDLTDRPLSRHRSSFCGSIEQVVDDLLEIERIGADVVVLAVPGERELDDVLGGYAAIAEGLELRSVP